MRGKQNWVITYGRAEIEGGQITHTPQRVAKIASEELQKAQGGKEVPPHTIAKSDVQFEQGAISWEVYLEDETSSCQILLPADPASAQTGATSSESSVVSVSESYLAIGLNCLGAPYGLAMLRNWSWEGIIGVGQGSTVPKKKWLQLSAKVSGSNVDVYVDGVRIISTSRQLRRGQIGLFMQGNSPVKFRNLTVEEQQPICFAVMQFTDEFNVLFSDVIKPVCEQYGYRVIKGDDFYTSGPILDDITRSIRQAALIIADITPDNPNVFYEVGYAHAIGKPTILLSDRKRGRLPFDVSGFRTLFYDNTIHSS